MEYDILLVKVKPKHLYSSTHSISWPLKDRFRKSGTGREPKYISLLLFKFGINLLASKYLLKSKKSLIIFSYSSSSVAAIIMNAASSAKSTTSTSAD